MPAKQNYVMVKLDPDARERLEAICKKRGMTQIALLARLVHWFSDQDGVIQHSVLQTTEQQALDKLAQSLLRKSVSPPGPEKSQNLSNSVQ